MRRSLLAAILACALAAPAGATGLSVNHVELPGVPLDMCLARGRSALSGAGLTLLNSTPDVAWGEFPNTGQLFAVYCLSQAGLAVVLGAAERAEVIDPVVTRVLEALRTSGRPQPRRK